MRRIINLSQMLEIQMGINLRGTDVGMSQQFLNRTQIARGFEHVAGEAVAQQMRMHALENTLSQ